MRSVRHFRDQITDPDLKRQVNGFIGQEAMHGREHRAFNDRLDQLGYPTKRVERFTAEGPGHPRAARCRRSRTWPPPPRSSTSPPRWPSSCSASEETRALFGHDEVRNLFLWHTLEESEHKAVAFDVYKAVGGSERMRVWTMNLMRYRLRGRHGRPGRSSRCSATAPPTGRATLRRSWRSFRRSPLVHREPVGASSATTTGPTSTPTTATPPSWSSAGGPSCSATHGTLNDKLVDRRPRCLRT